CFLRSAGWERRRGDPEISGDSVDGQGRLHVRRTGRNAGGIREINLVDDFAGRRAAILDAGGLASDCELAGGGTIGHFERRQGSVIDSDLAVLERRIFWPERVGP